MEIACRQAGATSCSSGYTQCSNLSSGSRSLCCGSCTAWQLFYLHDTRCEVHTHIQQCLQPVVMLSIVYKFAVICGRGHVALHTEERLAVVSH